MNKREINLLAAQLLGFDKIMNKHTHIVWGRKDGKQQQINIYKHQDQLLQVTDILVDKMKHDKLTGKDMICHFVRTRSPVSKALEEFAEEALTRLKSGPIRRER